MTEMETEALDAIPLLEAVDSKYSTFGPAPAAERRAPEHRHYRWWLRWDADRHTSCSTTLERRCTCGSSSRALSLAGDWRSRRANPAT